MEAAWICPHSRMFFIKFAIDSSPSWTTGPKPLCCVVRTYFLKSKREPTMLPGPCELSCSSSAASFEGAVPIKPLAGRLLPSAGGGAGVFRLALLGRARSRQTSRAGR